MRHREGRLQGSAAFFLVIWVAGLGTRMKGGSACLGWVRLGG
jgi:hypothetical protein